MMIAEGWAGNRGWNNKPAGLGWRAGARLAGLGLFY